MPRHLRSIAVAVLLQVSEGLAQAQTQALRHTFGVMASNGNGTWTEPVSSAPFTVLLRFYETWWFAATMVAIAALVIGIAYKIRVQQITRVMNARFDERLAERTRVARELHDTLLQTIHGSKMVADRALRDTPDPSRLVHALEQLSTWLGQAAEEGRAALQSLRSTPADTNDLAAAFRRAIDECSYNAVIKMTLTVHGASRTVPPLVHDEIYRIGYEAIRNACVHSGASRIDVGLEYGANLTLRVSDDGAGIDAAIIEHGKDGHFGLRGMRERAERIGGKIAIVSSPGSGTVVTLMVPGSTIY
jgi:signal transduction histidine kinase